jgi:uncharacterized phage protein (TIGR01671 family)
VREIKFRGKQKNGTWVVGYLLKMFCEIGIMTLDNENEFNPVDPSTVGQYTGLHDKNGKEIFEGDIIKFMWDKKINIDVVEYSAPMFSPSKSCRWSMWQDEVIGNIYDNPLSQKQ